MSPAKQRFPLRQFIFIQQPIPRVDGRRFFHDGLQLAGEFIGGDQPGMRPADSRLDLTIGADHLDIARHVYPALSDGP